MADKEKTSAQAKYSTAELIAASKKIFGYTGALVASALLETGKSEFTLSEAEAVVKKFAARPIRRN